MDASSIMGLTIEIKRALRATTFVKLAAFFVMKLKILVALLIVQEMWSSIEKE